MPVKVRCRDCEEVLSLPDRARGKTVRCPNCEAPVKVPSGAKSAAGAKRAAAADDDSGDEDFLAGLDLDRLEDRHARVCPRCGADVPEDEFECPRCFVDIRTGKVTEKRRRKLERKGPDPSEFYRTAWSDGWRFVSNNRKLALRTFLYLTLFGLPAFGLMLLAVYFHKLPLKVFFSFLMLVATLAIPGWLWYLWLEVIQGTLAKKPKLKRVPFDFFLNASLGLKAIAWLIVFGLPILLIPGGIGGLLISNGNAIAGGIVIGFGCLLLLPLVPIGLAHMTMPVTWPGWVSPYCARTFLKVAGPTLFWLLFALIALTPYIASSVVGGIVARRDTEDVVNTVRFNAALYSAVDELKALSEGRDNTLAAEGGARSLNTPHLQRLGRLMLDPGVQRLVSSEWLPKIQIAMASSQAGQQPQLPEMQGIDFPFLKLILPAVFLVLNAATLAVGALFCMRMNGFYTHYFKRDLDLITLTAEKKYVSKEQKVDEAGEPIPASSSNAVKWLAGIGGVILFYAIANVVLYFASGGQYTLLPNKIARALNLLK